MFYIIGIIVVFGSVVVGYTMHGGNLMVLYQPNEYIIILGAAIGSVLIGYPISCIKKYITSSIISNLANLSISIIVLFCIIELSIFFEIIFPHPEE